MLVHTRIARIAVPSLAATPGAGQQSKSAWGQMEFGPC